MPLDPHVKRFLSMLAVGGERGVPAGIEERRQSFQRLLTQAGSWTGRASVRDIVLPGGAGPIPARLAAPLWADAALLPGLIFFHGGGFTAGDLDTHQGLCDVLAAEAGCRVVSIGYRLAPEHPFPAAVDDAWAASLAVAEGAAEFGIDPRHLAIGGDSVGSTLAVVTSQTALRRRFPAFAAQLLICPVLDGSSEGGSRSAFGQGYFLDRPTIQRDMAAYAPHGLDLSDPRATPLMTRDLVGSPPAIIHVAEYDPVRDDGELYARRLSEAGVPVRFTCHAGMIHLFYGFGRIIPYGEMALKDIGRELASLLTAASPQT